MASAASAPTKVFATFAAIAALVGLSQVSLGALFVSAFTGPGSYSRMFAVGLLLANLKNFPYMWHVRVYGAILKHFLLTPREFRPETGGPAALFQPVITSSRSPVTECDYNIHKSNSTYFSDMDVTRTHLVSSLLRRGIQALQKNTDSQLVRDPTTQKVANGKWYIMLGAVHCSFKQEIKPYAKYEMWTRVLAWDRKWLYLVTHFVKPGTVRPDGYTLDTGRVFGSRAVPGAGKETVDDPAWPLDGAVPAKAIYASAVAKYVVKLGRLSVHPEITLEASGLLPSRPGGWATMDGSVSVNDEERAKLEAAAPIAPADEWDWRRVVAENERGLKYAEHFAALDGLHDTFTGEKRPAIGVYRDLFW